MPSQENPRPRISKRISILLADDSTQMRHMIKDMLRRLGFENVIQVSGGEEALTSLKSRHVDVILCDWNLPGISGREILRQVRETPEWRDMPFIMVTAEMHQGTVALAGEAKVDGYILKPFTMDVLYDKLVAAVLKRRAPSVIDQLLDQGFILLDQDDVSGAEKNFMDALDLNPKSPRILYALGLVQERRDDPTAAKELLERAVAHSPKFVKAREALARVHKQLGLHEEAAKQLRLAARVSPDNPERQLMLGQTLLESGDLEGAQKALKQTMRLSKHGGNELARELGEAMLKAGMGSEAEDCFQTALKDNPDDIYTYNQLGIAFRKQGKFDEAVDNYQRALMVAPDNEVLHFNLSRAYLEAGDRDSSEKAMRRALEINPGFNEAKKFLKKMLKVEP